MAGRRKATDLIARVVFLVLGAPASAALAHHGALRAPDNLWRTWSWDPTVLLGLALAAWGYARGMRGQWRRAGASRATLGWQAAAFAGGLGVVFAAVISPLDALATVLLSAHMLQHLALILLAAPLLVLGAPWVLLVRASPKPLRRAFRGSGPLAVVSRPGFHVLGQPLLVWTLHAASVWLWHLPSLYEAALHNQLVHALEHASFLGTALLFWWTVARPDGRARLGYGAGILYVFAAGVQSGALGALMTFATTPWYPTYAARVGGRSLAPLEDQQLAGLIMWVPAGLVYLVAILVLFAAWLRAEERGVRAREGQLGAEA